MRGRTQSSRVVLLALLGTLILLSQVAYPMDIQQTEQRVTEDPKEVAVPAYTLHSPIVISNNSDFETQGWPGNGTVSDPYIIEGLNITSDGICIDIETTSANFLIQECYLKSSMSFTLNLEYAHNGTINRCAISNAAGGISVLRCNDTTIANSTIEASFNAFMASESHRTTLFNSTLLLTGTEFAVIFGGSSSSSIRNCTFTDAMLKLVACSNITIEGNIFSNGGLVIGSPVGPYNPESIHWNHSVSDNSVNGETLGYFKNQSDMVLDGDSFGQVILFDCVRMKVEGGRIEDAAIAVQLAYSSNCTVSDLEISGWGAGVTILASNFTVIDNCYKFGALHSGSFATITTSFYCNITNNLEGGSGTSIWIDSGSNHFISGNSMFPDNWGIKLYSEECTISDNFVMNCQRGIRVDGSRHIIRNNTILESMFSGIDGILTNASIANNVIREGFYDGIEIFSSNSIITGNWITENGGIGVNLREGSNGNQIFNNSIGRNDESNAHDDGFSNLWDDGVSIGNLWGNFLPGMTPPYQIPGAAGSEDRYPLSDTIPPVLKGLALLNTSLHHNFPIQWYAFDFSPDRYEIYINGDLDFTGDAWLADMITYRIDSNDLGLGLHNVTLVAYDAFGNLASHTVMVQVGLVISTPTSPYEPPEFDLVIIILIVGGLAGVVVIIVVWWKMKR